MIRWEAVLIAGLGAALGLGIGVVFGWMLTRALADEGISTSRCRRCNSWAP